MHLTSIKDIARAAGVSHSTVSRALRGSPLVNAKTSALIKKIAAERGYTPSAVARSLVSRHTNTIGVVCTSVADPFVGEVVAGIEELALMHGYAVFLANCHADPEREMRVVRAFHERRVDGILVTASRVGALYMPLLAEMKVPIVLINSQHPDPFVYSVTIANHDAGREATRHLLRLGHRRIAYMGDRFGFQSDAERMAGYRRALTEARLRFRRELVVRGDGGAEGGTRAMLELLSLPEPPTAVFCYNDMQAFGAMRAARDHGIKVPRDLSVVGIDDLFLSTYTDPPLTTVAQPKQEMGRTAMQILLSLIAGEDRKSTVTLPGKLILRNSTAPPKTR